MENSRPDIIRLALIYSQIVFSSPEQKLRVSYCDHPLPVIVRRQQLVC